MCGQEKPPGRTNGTILIRAQFKTGTTLFALCINQMAHIKLTFPVLRGELDMLLTPPVFKPQLIIRRSAQDVARVVITGDVVRVFRVVLSICNIRPVRVAAIKHHRHFRSVKQRCMPAVSVTSIWFRQPQPQVSVTLFAAVAVKVQLHPVTPLRIQPGVSVAFLRALHARRQ